MMFNKINHKTVEIYTFKDENHKIWTIEFEDNKFVRTSYDLKAPYSRADWAALATFAGIIENLCLEKETPYIPENVMVTETEVTEPTDEEEQQWKILETKNGFPPQEGNA